MLSTPLNSCISYEEEVSKLMILGVEKMNKLLDQDTNIIVPPGPARPNKPVKISFSAASNSLTVFQFLQSLPAGTVAGWPSGSLMTPVLSFLHSRSLL